MTVVKVGGSLFDNPQLGPNLRAWLAAQGWILEPKSPDLPERPVLLIPGGGDFAEAVRKLDRIHGLRKQAAHRIALQSLTVSAQFLHHLLPEAQLVSDLSLDLAGVNILQSFADVPELDKLPESWSVTSDSLAAHVARIVNADRLILLKSVPVPSGMSWQEAAKQGIVDEYFPTIAAGGLFPIVVETLHGHAKLPDSTPTD